MVFSRKLLKYIIVFITALACWSSVASAANVRFVGSVGYSAIANIVLLVADEVHNFDASGTSGSLRLELWATPMPFAGEGSFVGGYRLAAYSFGPLAAGASLKKVESGVLPYTLPPSGRWYVALVLTEYTGGGVNGGYSVDNYLRFPDQISGSGPPPTDTTPPTVSITSPATGNVSGTVTMAANASDNVGVTRVDFYVKGALVGSDNSAPYQYSWNTTALANGAATLYARAFDAAGNSTQSATVTVNVSNAPPPDTTPPSVSITSPAAGNVSGNVTMAANASDNVGVTRVDFYVKGALVGSDNSAPYQYSWNTTSLANGAATLYARAFDAAGNSTQSATVTVNVSNAPPPDTTPPSVSITSPAER